jgi:hemoglobin
MTSIYDLVGGAPAFERLALALHERCVADPVLNHAFDRDDLSPDHLPRLAAYLSEACGGPALYTRDFGGESAMQHVHAGNGPEDAFYVNFLGCFEGALDDADFPAEVHDTLRSYMDDALVRMRAYGPIGSVVPADLPLTHVAWP